MNRNDPPVTLNRSTAKPCPWCGEQPEMEFWHGGGPGKRRIGCSNDSCPASPSVTGASRQTALRNWNQRKEPKP